MKKKVFREIYNKEPLKVEVKEIKKEKKEKKKNGNNK